MDNSSSYDFMDKYAYVYAIDTIASVGVVGNILLLILMFHSSSSQYSYSIYLRYLAVFDSMVLIFTVTEDTIEKLYSFEMLNSDFFNTRWKCYLWSIPEALSRTISPWILAGMSIDRFILIVFPQKRAKFCTKKKSHIFCSCVFVGAILVNIAYVICDQDTACYLGDGSCGGFIDNSILFETLAIVANTLLPVAIIFVTNVYTIYTLRRMPVFRGNAARRRMSVFEGGREKRFKTTMALGIVALVSFVALFPKAMVELLEIIWEQCCPNMRTGGTRDRTDLAWHITNALMLLNFAQNFYILMLASTIHRSVVLKLCGCHKNEELLLNEESDEGEIEFNDDEGDGREVEIQETHEEDQRAEQVLEYDSR